MKLAIAALVLFVSSVSFAEVKPPGTFVPSLCSDKQAAAEVESVCLGKVVGEDGSVIRLNLKDGAVRDYDVEVARKPGRMGVTVSRFSGNVRTIRMMDRIEGELTTTSGITVTFGISLETETTGLKFNGPLHMVFVTQ